MKIKLLQKVIVGGVQTPQNAGSVVEVDDTEGRQLIDAGYAEAAAAGAKVESLQNDTANMGTGDYQRMPAGVRDGEGNLLAGNALRNVNPQSIGKATADDAEGESKATVDTNATKAITGGTSNKGR